MKTPIYVVVAGDGLSGKWREEALARDPHRQPQPIVFETNVNGATLEQAQHNAASAERWGYGPCRVGRVVFEDEPGFCGMSSASTQFEIGAVALGYFGTVASWRRLAPRVEKRGIEWCSVTIQSCADTDEGAHTPAASVSVNGRVALLALRAAIDEALREPEK